LAPETAPESKAEEPVLAPEATAQEVECETWLPWWMPVVALVAPIISGAWQGATADADVFKHVMTGLLWPGLPLYFGLIALFWAAWKIELE